MFSFWLLSGSVSGFLLAPGPGWVVYLQATLLISPPPASWGRFCCNQEGEASDSCLWGTVQSLRKIVGAFPPALIPPILVCPSLFPIMYGFCLNSCLFHEGVGVNLCKCPLSHAWYSLKLCVQTWAMPWIPLVVPFLNLLLWCTQWNRITGHSVLFLPVGSWKWALLGVNLAVLLFQGRGRETPAGC